MPYVDRHERVMLGAGRPPATVGSLTFFIQQTLRQYLGSDYSYGDIAECLGALEGAKADLVERVLKPYEETKCEENGDVW